MVKLASAREGRMYGPRPVRNRWECINAGTYVFATIPLIGGLAAQLSPGGTDAKSGLVLLLIGIALIAAVNAHDLVAHMAGVDYCLSLVGFDPQLALVEFAVPSVQLLGSILTFIAVIFLLIQLENGYSHKLEKQAGSMLIAGPALWVVGSTHNLCQIYERADGHFQILQKSVQIPFIMGSLLFMVGGVFNQHEISGSVHLVGKSWVWLCMSGSLLFLIGGVMNVAKVVKMQLQAEGVRLERLRGGGGQQRLCREREGKAPLIIEDSGRRKPSEVPVPVPVSTPYKDVLVSGSQV